MHHRLQPILYQYKGEAGADRIGYMIFGDLYQILGVEVGGGAGDRGSLGGVSLGGGFKILNPCPMNDRHLPRLGLLIGFDHVGVPCMVGYLQYQMSV